MTRRRGGVPITHRTPLRRTAAGLALLPHHVLAHPVGGWNGGGPGWLFLLVPLVWLVVLAVLVAVVGRRWRRGGAPWAAARQAAPSAAAEAVLAQRFANGDVDEVEQVLAAIEERPEVTRLVVGVRKRSPIGKAVLGKKEGDRIMVYVNENYSYEAIIKSITKSSDDGSAPILQY